MWLFIRLNFGIHVIWSSIEDVIDHMVGGEGKLSNLAQSKFVKIIIGLTNLTNLFTLAQHPFAWQ